MGDGVSLYLVAVLEYLYTKILELASSANRDNKKCCIVPRHITLVVKNEEELNKLIGSVTIVFGGILPNIHTIILRQKSSTKKWWPYQIPGTISIP